MMTQRLHQLLRGIHPKLVSATVAASIALAATPCTAETRGYAISKFQTATFSDKTSCPHGGNGASIDISRRTLRSIGYSPAEVERILVNKKDAKGRPLSELVLLRGPNHTKVDPFNDPEKTVVPQMELVSGKLGPGFNLDGDVNTGFEDPETHEKGVDNQLFRIVGCFQQYAVSPPVVPFYEDVMWDTMFDTMPAWVFSISGPNLSADGPITLSFNRALQHLRRNASGGALANATFAIETQSRSATVVRGEIRAGVIYIQDGDLHLEGEAPILTQLRLRKLHARLKIEADGSLSGLIGGYEPWMDFYYMASAAGEGNIGLDIPGLYHAFTRLADADPDPKTGKNTGISVAYRIQAVPAFLENTQGQLLANSALAPQAAAAAGKSSP